MSSSPRFVGKELYVGVEIGQLAFIAVVLGVTGLARRTPLSGLKHQALPVTARAIGILAAFWFCQRLAEFI